MESKSSFPVKSVKMVVLLITQRKVQKIFCVWRMFDNTILQWLFIRFSLNCSQLSANGHMTGEFGRKLEILTGTTCQFVKT